MVQLGLGLGLGLEFGSGLHEVLRSVVYSMKLKLIDDGPAHLICAVTFSTVVMFLFLAEAALALLGLLPACACGACGAC